MKRLIIGSIMSASILLAGNAQANYIDKNTEAYLVRICEALQSNSKLKVRNAIKKSGFKPRAISEGLVCNGYDPVTFAIVSGSRDTAKYMARLGGVDYESLLAKL